MNYLKVYNQLIKKRRESPINKDHSKPFEVEYHHIIPVACNGKNDPKKKYVNHEGTNIIGLTLREHFVAHWLLAKIYNDKFMNSQWNAFSHMCGKYSTANKKTYIRCTSKTFEIAKKNAGKYTSQINKGKIIVNNGIKELRVLSENIPLGFVKGKLGKRITINNGIITKRILENNPIPNGFVKGDLSTKNKHWINNGQLQKMVTKDEDLPVGWIIGRIITWSRKGNCSNKIWVNDGIKQLRIDKNYIPNGFIIGCLSSQNQSGKGHKGMKWGNNGIINKLIDPTNIPKGFVLGLCKK